MLPVSAAASRKPSARSAIALYDSVSARIRRQGVEQWLPFFYERLETVFDYAGEDALIAFDALAEEAIKERVETARDHYEFAQDRADCARRLAVPRARAGSALSRRRCAEARAWRTRACAASRTSTPTPRSSSTSAPAQAATSRPNAQTADANVFDAAAKHVDALTKAKKRVVIAAWSDGSAERLAGVLADHGVEGMWPRRDLARSGSAAARARTRSPCCRSSTASKPRRSPFLAEQDILGDRLARPRKRRKASSVHRRSRRAVAGRSHRPPGSRRRPL